VKICVYKPKFQLRLITSINMNIFLNLLNRVLTVIFKALNTEHCSKQRTESALPLGIEVDPVTTDQAKIL